MADNKTETLSETVGQSNSLTAVVEGDTVSDTGETKLFLDLDQGHLVSSEQYSEGMKQFHGVPEESSMEVYVDTTRSFYNSFTSQIDATGKHEELKEHWNRQFVKPARAVQAASLEEMLRYQSEFSSHWKNQDQQRTAEPPTAFPQQNPPQDIVKKQG